MIDPLKPERHLDWEGCFNVRDLGGLPAADGRRTRPGAIIRADLLGRLTSKGRRQMLAYGVRTIIDLRSPRDLAGAPPVAFLTRHAFQRAPNQFLLLECLAPASPGNQIT